MCNSIIAQIPQKRTLSFEQVRASAQAAGLTVAHSEGGGFYVIPSATEPGVTYTVYLGSRQPTCSCPAQGRCWHIARARQLAAAADLSFEQALDDLFRRQAA